MWKRGLIHESVNLSLILWAQKLEYNSNFHNSKLQFYSSFQLEQIGVWVGAEHIRYLTRFYNICTHIELLPDPEFPGIEQTIARIRDWIFLGIRGSGIPGIQGLMREWKRKFEPLPRRFGSLKIPCK